MNFVLVFTFLNLGRTVFSCPKKCICENYGIDHLMDCNTREINQIPDGIPEWTTVINLDGNLISTLNFNLLPTAKYLKKISVRYSQVTKLVVTKNSTDFNIKARCSHVFRYFAQLQFIDLSNNQITYLPSCFLTSFPNLRTLILSNNFIKEVTKLNLINPLLRKNSGNQVETLNLKGNKLTVLNFKDSNVPHNPLEEMKLLDVRNNSIKQIQSGFFMHFRKLEEIKLSWNCLKYLNDFSFITLGKSIKKLDLSSNKIESLSKLAFVGLKNLTVLNLSNNKLTSMYPETISTNLQHSYTISFQMHRSWGNKWLMNFGSLIKIRLSDNLFNCNCTFYRRIIKGKSSSNLFVMKTLLNEKCINLYPSTKIKTFVETRINC